MLKVAGDGLGVLGHVLLRALARVDGGDPFFGNLTVSYSMTSRSSALSCSVGWELLLQASPLVVESLQYHLLFLLDLRSHGSRSSFSRIPSHYANALSRSVGGPVLRSIETAYAPSFLGGLNACPSIVTPDTFHFANVTSIT
jgi:hypothetical protein